MLAHRCDNGHPWICQARLMGQPVTCVCIDWAKFKAPLDQILTATISHSTVSAVSKLGLGDQTRMPRSCKHAIYVSTETHLLHSAGEGPFPLVDVDSSLYDDRVTDRLVTQLHHSFAGHSFTFTHPALKILHLNRSLPLQASSCSTSRTLLFISQLGNKLSLKHDGRGNIFGTRWAVHDCKRWTLLVTVPVSYYHQFKHF